MTTEVIDANSVLPQNLPKCRDEFPSPERLVRLSFHSRVRANQRGIDPMAIQWAYAVGQLVHGAGRDGADYLFMGRREIADACDAGADPRFLERYDGLVVVVDPVDGQVITQYRVRRAIALVHRHRRAGRRFRRQFPFRTGATNVRAA